MELEDPKDLRARFRKFLILTNERKKMSKTTLRKRISLVAVTALTAGVLSVVASPAANANIAANSPQSQATFTNDNLNVAVIASTTGAAISNGTTANLNKSLGLIYKDASSTTAQSATMLATGALALYTLVSATNIGITATGGAFSSPANSGASTETPAIAASLRGVLTNATATNVAVVWTPGAVGTYVISMYEGNGTTYPDSSLGLARGDLKSQITVTVVASGAAGAYAATYTLCNVGSSGGSAAATDVSGASAINNGGTGFIHFNLKDAYNTQLATASASAVTASTTGSAVLDIASNAAGAIAASDVVTSTTSGTVAIKQATAGVPTTATVTLSYGGTVVCTKTLTFQGEVASLKAKAVRAQTTSSGNEIVTDPDRAVAGGTIEVEAFDSAGNKVNPLAADGSAAATTQFGTVASTVSSLTVSSITFGTVATGVAGTSADGLWPVSSTLAYHSCAGRGTNDKLQVTFQNPSGTIITSPAFSARCAAAAVSYKASWDKASYVQGDIAKLTVQWFDQYGNPAPSSGAATKGTVTGATPTITAPMMTLVGTLTNNHGVDVNGSKVWTYTVGTSGTFTEGSYQGLIDYSALSGTTGAIQTVAYKVALTGTPGVSNADVLKSIVALIASINKQIQALQKLILKRR
jgi:hypothetical protein